MIKVYFREIYPDLLIFLILREYFFKSEILFICWKFSFENLLNFNQYDLLIDLYWT